MIRVPPTKSITFPAIASMSRGKSWPADTKDCNDAMITTATRSSTMRTPIIIVDEMWCNTPMSSRTFTMMVVLLIERAAARNSESSGDQWKPTPIK